MQNASWGTSPAPVEPRGYRTPAAAAYLGISEPMVRKLVSLGSLAAIHLGCAVVFDRSDLDRLIDSNKSWGTR